MLTALKRWITAGAAALATVAMATVGGAFGAPAAMAESRQGDATQTSQLAASKSSTTPAPAAAGSLTSPAAYANDGIIAIAFQQPWTDVAQECEQTYGPEGVRYVEVSPPNETITGSQWWTSYQPVSYKLDSKLGTQAQFASMVKSCKAAGVGIVADVVLNQTTGSDSAKKDAAGNYIWQQGVAGTRYNPGTGDYPGFGAYGFKFGQCNATTAPFNVIACDKGNTLTPDFHDWDNGASITNYTNQTEVQQGRLSTMWDINTSSPYVQDVQSDYLAALWKTGVVGFRIDAAKHMNATYLAQMKEALARKIGVSAANIWWTQEVIPQSGAPEGLMPPAYYNTGMVTNFNYAWALKSAFAGSITGLRSLTNAQETSFPSKYADVFVDNWDTERGDGTLNAYADGAKYMLANAFMLADNYGQPRILSDYYFTSSTSNDGAPGATDTSVPAYNLASACAQPATKAGQWGCEERWTPMRGMIAFHNYVGDSAVSPLQQWQSANANNIAFSRGTKGFIAINNGTGAQAVDYTTSLPDGTYCNVYAAGDCSQTVAVSGGHVRTSIPAQSAVALYTGATPSSHPSGAAKDPSTPTWTVADTNPVTDRTLTIYYKPDSSWKDAYVQYGINGTWTTAPGKKMTKIAGSQWYSYTISNDEGDAVNFCFSNGEGQWDNPNGAMSNYTAAEGTTYIAVANKQVTYGNPVDQPYDPSTEFIVHYKGTNSDPADLGVYVWGTDTVGNQLSGTWYPFTGTDSYGKVFDHTFAGAYSTINYIVTTKDWHKVGGDRSASLSAAQGAPGTANAKNVGVISTWVNGADPNATLSQAPDGYAKTPTKLTVTIHYHRNDGIYQKMINGTYNAWDVWYWASSQNGKAAEFTHHDGFGEIASYTLTSADGVRNPDFILRNGGSAWLAKDPGDGDRAIPQNAIVMHSDGTATADVWLVQGDWNVYLNPKDVRLTATITKADISAMNQITAVLSDGKAQQAALAGKVILTGPKGANVPVKSVSVSGNVVTVTAASDLAPNAGYTVSIPGYGSKLAIAGAVVRTAAFDNKYYYSGDDLGATYASDGTTFKLWAPTASSVSVQTYASDASADAAKAASYAMTRDDSTGVWTVRIPGDCNNLAYTYEVSFPNGTTNTSPDPYARAAVINGERSVVLSPAATQIADFRRMASTRTSNTQALIAEMDVRDFSTSPTWDAGNGGRFDSLRGTYLGLAQTGTKNAAGAATGLDYVKKMGITDLQIMPFFDFAGVDETQPASKRAYNWGYNPRNYNVPSSVYSTDSADPAAAVKQVKQMVQGVNKQGIGVVMDVVYNHVNDAATSPFGLTVPGYYFRYNADGQLVNSSGCGNTVASERKMVRKYIVDSVTYWAKTYNLSGFRFDLMGLIDLDTMKAVRAALDKIDPHIIVLGEGWQMSQAMSPSEMAIQPNAYELDNTGSNGTRTGSTVAMFNDSIRDAIKGSTFTASDPGFVQGADGKAPLLMHNLLGCQYVTESGAAICSNGQAQDHYADAQQVVQYASIHDGLTLYDKLVASMPKKQGESDADYLARIEKADKLANSLVLLGYGVPELQLGQAMMRTKGGNSNSYNAPDSVNEIDWSLLDDSVRQDSINYVAGLAKLRKALPALQTADYSTINGQTKVLQASGHTVAWKISRDGHTYVLIVNAGSNPVSIKDIDNGYYAKLVDSSEVMAVPQPASTTKSTSKASLLATDTSKSAVKADPAAGTADSANVIHIESGEFAAPAMSTTVLESTEKPTEPTKPSEPNKPSEPTKPTQPTNPTNPTEPNKNSGASSSSTSKPGMSNSGASNNSGTSGNSGSGLKASAAAGSMGAHSGAAAKRLSSADKAVTANSASSAARPSMSLARTGSNVAWIVVIAAVAAAIGAWIIIAVRRKK